MEVELDESEQDGMVPAARRGEMAAKAKQTFEEALEQIKPGADAIVDKLRGISAQPDEISITFGLKMSATAGAFIAASGMEANFAVLLKWNRE
jgi:NTP-dependent ternary system trypsin peptidase co-occuring protein